MQRLRVQRGRLKSIFGIDRTASEEPPNRPSGGWRGCAVPAFSPQAKTLAQGWLCHPEHSNAKGWSRPSGGETQNKRASFRMPFCFGAEGGIRTLARFNPTTPLAGEPLIATWVLLHGCKCSWGIWFVRKKVAERVGFEPTALDESPVFKTGSLNHSDISPRLFNQRRVICYHSKRVLSSIKSWNPAQICQMISKADQLYLMPVPPILS